MLTDIEIAEIIEPYLIDNTTNLFEFLTEDMIDPRYRIMPKTKILYRGKQIPKKSYDAAKTSDSIVHSERKYYRSFTTSLATAKEFCQGLMGNDYDNSPIKARRFPVSRETKIGIVFQKKLEDNTNVVLAVGSFLRTAKISEKFPNLYQFSHENEWILRNAQTDVKKSDIVHVTHRVF